MKKLRASCMFARSFVPSIFLGLIFFSIFAFSNKKVTIQRISKVIAYGENQRSTCEAEVKF